MQEELRKEVQTLHQSRALLWSPGTGDKGGRRDTSEKLEEPSQSRADPIHEVLDSPNAPYGIKIRPNVHYYPAASTSGASSRNMYLTEADPELPLDGEEDDDSQFYPPPPTSPPPTDDSTDDFPGGGAFMEPPPVESPTGTASADANDSHASPLSVVLEIDIGEGAKRNIAIHKDSDPVV